MIMTMEETIGITQGDMESEEESDVQSNSDGNPIKTDSSKAMFTVEAYSGELGVSVSMVAVTVTVDTKEFKVGEAISESIGNMVWPCRNKVNPCTPDEFFAADGYSAEFKAGIRLE